MKTVMTNLKVLFFYILLYLTFGCNDSNSIKHYKVPKSNHNISKHESNTNSEGNLKWIKPDSWIQYNGSSLRLLSFKIPYSNNEADMYENNLMRRISGLLYLDDKIVGSIKEKIRKNLF